MTSYCAFPRGIHPGNPNLRGDKLHGVSAPEVRIRGYDAEARALCAVVDSTQGRMPEHMTWLKRHYGADITTRTWNTLLKVAAEAPPGLAAPGRQSLPAEAEGVPGGVGVDAEAIALRGPLQKPGTQTRGLFMGGVDILHDEIQVDLLRWVPLGPLRRDVIRSQLHGDLVDPVDINAVPVIVAGHGSAEHRRPKGTLSLHISRVEHNGLSCNLHTGSLEAPPAMI